MRSSAKRAAVLLWMAVAMVACGATPIEFGDGFYPPEPAADNTSFRWMSDEGVINLENPQRDMALVLEGMVPLSSLMEPPVVQIRLNGTTLQEITPTDESYRWRFEVPASTMGSDPSVALSIRTSQTFVPREVDPASQDIRRLGLVVHVVSWEGKQ